jgi:outer membrane protein assembly factor BamB
MRKLPAFWILVLTGLSILGTVSAENWPQWRGPLGNGVSPEKGVPLQWDENENVAWKAPLGGVAVSSPVVWEDTAFVTSQTGKGNQRGGSHPTLARGEQEADEKPLRVADNASEDARVTFVVEAFAVTDGKRLWQYTLPAEGDFPDVHSKHNMASPSPVTDGEFVYAWFATGQIVALGMDGQLVWKRHLGQEISPFVINWGHGSSPTLYEGLLILQCYHLPASHLLALDKKTGQEVWRIDRGQGIHSHCTPFVAKTGSREELIVNSNQRIDAYNPLTGELLWHAGEAVRYAIPAPAFENGVLYMSRGYRSGPYLAVRTGGSGDVSETHVVWRVGRGAPYISSLLCYQGLVYMVNGLGIATCVDGATGKRVWQERIGGIYSASPVAAEGRIYLLNESGETVVLRAGPELNILERNPLGERVVASPAISDGGFFVRTDSHLICVRNPSEPMGLLPKPQPTRLEARNLK